MVRFSTDGDGVQSFRQLPGTSKPHPVLLGSGPPKAASETKVLLPGLWNRSGCKLQIAAAAAKLPIAAASAKLPAAAFSSNDSDGDSSGDDATPVGAVVRRQSFILQHDEGAKLDDVYDVEDSVLGVGAFGTVRKAKLRSAPSVVRAVKTIRTRNMRTENAVRQEIAVLKRLDHPRICRLLETFEDDESMCLILELVEGRELFDVILAEGSFSERRAAVVMHQAMAAIAYCHERGVMHRDLKPENIMVVEQAVDTPPFSTPQSVTDVCKGLEVKLIDFGLAILCGSQSRMRGGSSVAGSPEYLAPEARRGKYLPASDVWSMGMILHVLLVGSLPDSKEVLLGEDELQLESALYSTVSLEARQLLSQMVTSRSADRLTAAAAAAHPWVEGSSEMHSSSFDPQTWSRLMAFHRSAKLRRAALTAVGMQITGQQLEILREQFLLIDADGNGRLSKDELSRAIETLHPDWLNGIHADSGRHGDVHSWIDAIFDAIDTDGSQEIEYTEWLAAAAHESAVNDQAALAAFRCFDLDGDGSIDAKELAHVLAQTPEEIELLLPEVDVNGDGVIDFSEFRRLLSGIAFS